jgi:probable F420-dependent oxidoreductase
MKFGLVFFPVRVNFLLPLAKRADELGYESTWIAEHLVFPSHVASAPPYEAGAPLPSTPLFDPLITLAYVAAQTQRIQLGTSIYILPLRHPIVAAKLVATLDALSNGRVLLGIGAGWLKEEFDCVEAPWEHRGARMEEAIHVMRLLWSEDRVAHEGRFFKFEEIGFEPKPVRRPLPILIGGESQVALKRAARNGNGWFGLRHTPESAAERVRELRAMKPGSAPFEITIQPATVPTRDDVRRFEDAGVDRLAIEARALSGGVKTVEGAIAGIDRFAETIVDQSNS